MRKVQTSRLLLIGELLAQYNRYRDLEDETKRNLYRIHTLMSCLEPESWHALQQGKPDQVGLEAMEDLIEDTLSPYARDAQEGGEAG